MREDVYNFVLKFLKDKNKSKITYFDYDVIQKLSFKKFGDNHIVDESSFKAFTDFYEGEEFLKRLG